MSEIVDSATIKSLVKGNGAAQRAVYDALAPKMYALCLRYVGKADAEDVLQDGFIVLFEKIGSYKGSGSFEGWARKVFTSTALMHLRKKNPLKYSEDVSQAFSVEDTSMQPLQGVNFREILGVIEQMPPMMRAVFNMSVDNYSHQEIAQELGISELSSRTTLKRAREWLRARVSR